MSDPNSFSNLQEVRQKHISFNLTVDFEKKVLTGYVDITADVLEPTTHFVLDVKGLTIHSAQLLSTSEQLEV